MCSSICTAAYLYRLTAYHNPSLCSGMDWIIIDGPRCQAKQKILALELSCIFKLRGHTRAVAERRTQAEANTSFMFFHVLSSNLNQSLWEFYIIESKTGSISNELKLKFRPNMTIQCRSCSKGYSGNASDFFEINFNCLHDRYFCRTLNYNILPCCISSTVYMVGCQNVGSWIGS